MEIRIARPDEWDSLAPIFEAEGGRAPHPDYATAAVAVDESGIAGFWMLQQVLHAGPLWIRPDRRGTRLWAPLNEPLAALAQKHGIPGFYSFSDGARMDHIFEQLGYQDLQYKVWKREV